MAQQGTITISGFVAADPVSFGRNQGLSACSFRMGCTRRYFDNASNTWKEHPTTWITVKAFRSLASNVRFSIHKGDPVLVTGVLNTEVWQSDGADRSRMVIEAAGIGHDLGFGVSSFQRFKKLPEASAHSGVGAADMVMAGGQTSGAAATADSRGDANVDLASHADGVELDDADGLDNTEGSDNTEGLDNTEEFAEQTF